LGGLLTIEPVLNVVDGALVPSEKIRGKTRRLRRVSELRKQRGDSLGGQLIAISHANNEETALEMKKMIEAEFGPKEIYINQIGAVIGSHTGQGTIAVFFLNRIR